jgi:lipopolysaccharide-induced tumor necrosis factor-alpha factor
MGRKEEEEVVAVGVPVYEGRGIPPNAVVGDPKGIPIQQTIYRDTPAPFNCPYCSNTSLTIVRFISLISFINSSSSSSSSCSY